MDDNDDDDSDLEIIIEGKTVHDTADRQRRTTVQLTGVVDHRFNHNCEDHFIAGKDSKTYYSSLRKERARELEREKEKAKGTGVEKRKPSIYEQLKAQKKDEAMELQKKRYQDTQQYISSSSTSSSTSSSYSGEMVGSVRVPPPSDVFRVNALARAKQMEEQRQQKGERDEII